VTADTVSWKLHVVVLAMLLLVASCSSGATSDSSAPHVAKHVIARSVEGSSGSPPTVVPRSAPGGRDQQVTLGDRTVRVDSASPRSLARDDFVAVDVDVTLQAVGPGAVENRPSDYSLLGPSGDVFGTTTDTSNPFWGALAATAKRQGTVTFEIPTAAQSRLQLLYRPGGTEEAVVFPLTLR
jgi:hypothetical protein